MKKSKEQRQKEKIAALLGLEAPTAVTQHESNQISMEAEAALEYYENPRSFKQKNCKSCGRDFATRGAPVAYCSDLCRARAFEERMGVKWQPLRSAEERWGFMGEPLTVGPDALSVVQSVMAEQEHAKAHPVGSAALNALVMDVYGPVLEKQQAEEQKLLDLFTELGIE